MVFDSVSRCRQEWRLITTKTSFESSANYNAQEFANDVVYVIENRLRQRGHTRIRRLFQNRDAILRLIHAILANEDVRDEIETVVGNAADYC